MIREYCGCTVCSPQPTHVQPASPPLQVKGIQTAEEALDAGVGSESVDHGDRSCRGLRLKMERNYQEELWLS